MVCRSLSYDGLALENLDRFNTALLGKWLWCFGVEQGALWREVITVKYGIECGGWISLMSGGFHGTGLWKFIRKGCDSFSRFVVFELGSGVMICFWHDVWYGESLLKLVYPELFRLSLS